MAVGEQDSHAVVRAVLAHTPAPRADRDYHDTVNVNSSPAYTTSLYHDPTSLRRL